MSTDPYTMMLVGIAKTGRRTSNKKKRPSRPNSFPHRPKHLRSISTEMPSQKKPVKSRKRFSFPTPNPFSGEKPVDVVDRKVCSPDTSLNSEAYPNVLSFQSFSRGQTSIFKLRDAGPRILVYSPSSELSKSNLSKHNSSNTSDSLPSLPNKPKQNSVPSVYKTEECELLTEQVNSSDSDFLMSSVVELPRSSPSLRIVEKGLCEYRCFSGRESSLSGVSDWRECFICSDADMELNIESATNELAIESIVSWRSSPNSQQNIPIFSSSKRLELNELELPPPGMVCVAWINTRTGNRFINLPLNTKLESVRVWLGSPLPMVIEEDGKRGRLCNSKATIVETVRKGIDPTKEGLGFFIGPVDGTVSYILKICELDLLNALRPTEQDEEEKL